MLRRLNVLVVSWLNRIPGPSPRVWIIRFPVGCSQYPLSYNYVLFLGCLCFCLGALFLLLTCCYFWHHFLYPRNTVAPVHAHHRLSRCESCALLLLLCVCYFWIGSFGTNSPEHPLDFARIFRILGLLAKVDRSLVCEQLTLIICKVIALILC